jgi:transcriptional antiterminator RfaH
MTTTADSDWFVAQLRPQGLIRAQAHLHRQGFETFAPEILVTTMRAGVPRQTRTPLFAGYLFVSFDPAVTGWSVINSTRGIARLILNDPRRPQPLPCALMAGLKARCDARGLLSPPADLSVGDRIRVLAGPFADLVTTIETVPGPERIGVLIDLMGRKVRTSVPRNQIEKLD